jgi:hypothetical protein
MFPSPDSKAIERQIEIAQAQKPPLNLGLYFAAFGAVAGIVTLDTELFGWCAITLTFLGFSRWELHGKVREAHKRLAMLNWRCGTILSKH